MNEKVESFDQLLVYQETCALDLKIFERTKSWPKEEMYSLTDQIRRSSRSIGANIAEAWAKRRYPAHFTSKLTDADGDFKKPSTGSCAPRPMVTSTRRHSIHCGIQPNLLVVVSAV